MADNNNIVTINVEFIKRYTLIDMEKILKIKIPITINRIPISLVKVVAIRFLLLKERDNCDISGKNRNIKPMIK